MLNNHDHQYMHVIITMMILTGCVSVVFNY